jgi:hypothetical protein
MEWVAVNRSALHHALIHAWSSLSFRWKMSPQRDVMSRGHEHPRGVCVTDGDVGVMSRKCQGGKNENTGSSDSRAKIPARLMVNETRGTHNHVSLPPIGWDRPADRFVGWSILMDRTCSSGRDCRCETLKLREANINARADSPRSVRGTASWGRAFSSMGMRVMYADAFRIHASLR